VAARRARARLGRPRRRARERPLGRTGRRRHLARRAAFVSDATDLGLRKTKNRNWKSAVTRANPPGKRQVYLHLFGGSSVTSDADAPAGSARTTTSDASVASERRETSEAPDTCRPS